MSVPHCRFKAASKIKQYGAREVGNMVARVVFTAAALKEIPMEFHLQEGQFKFRTPDGLAAIASGTIAAFILICAAGVTIVAHGANLWGPIRMVAAIVLGGSVFVESASHDVTLLVVALTVHFALAIGFSVVLATVIEACNLSFNSLMTLIVGAVFGASLYLINFYAMTAVFSWFVDARTWTNFGLHVLYGVVAGVSYVRIARPRKLAIDASRTLSRRTEN